MRLLQPLGFINDQEQTGLGLCSQPKSVTVRPRKHWSVFFWGPYLPMWWLTSDSLYLIKGLEQLQLLLEKEKQEQSCSLQSRAFGKQRSGSASGAQQKEGPCCHLQPKETNRKQIPSTGFAPIFSDKVEADHRVNLGALSRGSIKTLNAFLTCTES